jgi:hypothetical protein
MFLEQMYVIPITSFSVRYIVLTWIFSRFSGLVVSRKKAIEEEMPEHKKEGEALEKLWSSLSLNKGMLGMPN